MWAVCEDCGELVPAEITNNGVMRVGHYVHCGWGHQCAVEDLKDDDDPHVMSAINSQR